MNNDEILPPSGIRKTAKLPENYPSWVPIVFIIPFCICIFALIPMLLRGINVWWALIIILILIITFGFICFYLRSIRNLDAYVCRAVRIVENTSRYTKLSKIYASALKPNIPEEGRTWNPLTTSIFVIFNPIFARTFKHNDKQVIKSIIRMVKKGYLPDYKYVISEQALVRIEEQLSPDQVP